MAIKRILLFLLLIAVAVASHFLKKDSQSTDSSDTDIVATADYFLENFALKQFNESGSTKYEIDGKRMEHYGNTGQTLIDTPDIRIFDDAKILEWQVKAQQALAENEQFEKIILNGNVTLQRPGSPQRSKMTVSTDSLTINPETQYLITQNDVKIIADTTELNGTSLEADLKKGLLTITAARGRYVP